VPCSGNAFQTQISVTYMTLSSVAQGPPGLWSQSLILASWLGSLHPSQPAEG
jgi:hypothetical protein